MKADIDAFVGTSPQFDDITMLSLEFKKKMRLSNPEELTVAADELFGNIAHYAYDAVTGSATVRVGMEEAPAAAWVTFMDHGKPYDPLAKPDPDITLSAEERRVCTPLALYPISVSKYPRD